VLELSRMGKRQRGDTARRLRGEASWRLTGAKPLNGADWLADDAALTPRNLLVSESQAGASAAKRSSPNSNATKLALAAWKCRTDDPDLSQKTSSHRGDARSFSTPRYFALHTVRGDGAVSPWSWCRVTVLARGTLAALWPSSGFT
jgi:hypothetical protein